MKKKISYYDTTGWLRGAETGHRRDYVHVFIEDAYFEHGEENRANKLTEMFGRLVECLADKGLLDAKEVAHIADRCSVPAETVELEDEE